MTDVAMLSRTSRTLLADRALKGSAIAWFSMIVVGQWVFAYYIFAFYGAAAAQGDFATWNKRLFHGIVEGDPAGNIAVGAHLLMSFIISVCGPLQLIPQIRNRFPAFHRFNGRIYMATAITISAAGLFMIVTRGGVSLIGDISLGLNGVLIIAFAAIALRHAIARDIDTHRRWALRMFVAVCGFLFGRLGFQAWIFLTGGLGHTNMYNGPFDVFWGFGMYLLPLAVLELYLRAQDRAGDIRKFAVAASILIATVLLGLGIILAVKNLWLPFI